MPYDANEIRNNWILDFDITYRQVRHDLGEYELTKQQIYEISKSITETLIAERIKRGDL